MGKAKTSQMQKKSTINLDKLSGCRKWSPTKEILDSNNLAKAISECLLNNDPEGVIEVIEIYLETVNMVEFAKKSHLPRATLYHSLKSKNPTIKTLAKFIHGTLEDKRPNKKNTHRSSRSIKSSKPKASAA